MFPGLIDVVVSLGGLVVAPVFDFLKKKFIPNSSDTPEQTISSLAITKPEAVGPFIDGTVRLKEVAIKFFNRDVIGEPSPWVVDLRASIRPISVIISFVILICITAGWVDNLDGIRLSSEAVISSWMGSRIALK